METILTEAERNRLIELVDLLNDLSVTQLDTDEANEWQYLLNKLLD